MYFSFELLIDPYWEFEGFTTLWIEWKGLIIKNEAELMQIFVKDDCGDYFWHLIFLFPFTSQLEKVAYCKFHFDPYFSFYIPPPYA